METEGKRVTGRLERMPSPDLGLPEVAAVARDLIRFDTTNHGGGRAAGRGQDFAAATSASRVGK